MQRDTKALQTIGIERERERASMERRGGAREEEGRRGRSRRKGQSLLYSAAVTCTETL